jgi:hypothetical protein
MKRKAQSTLVSKRYQVFEDTEYGTQVFKVWDTMNHNYVYGTCESQWAWQECNRLNGTTR